MSGWEVEWCNYIERDEDGIDPDSARYCTKDFDTKERAVAYAEKMLPYDQFGSVRVTPFHSEQYEPGVPAYYREHDGDSEYVEA